MTHPGPWIEQDTLTGSTTLTPGHDYEDFSGGDGFFTVAISNNSTFGVRDATNFGQPESAQWDLMRATDPAANNHTRSNGVLMDWASGFTIEYTPGFGYKAHLQSQSFRIDAVAFNDPFNDEWPPGVVGVELEGTGEQFWDITVEAVGTLDDFDNRGGDTGDYDFHVYDPGSYRVSDQDITTNNTWPQELFSVTPATHVVERLNVPSLSSALLGTRVTPILDILTGSAPTLIEDHDMVELHQFSNTYVLNVDVTVRRPRYRYIFEGGGLAPLRRYPREDGYGPSATRHYPPSRSRRAAGGYY